MIYPKQHYLDIFGVTQNLMEEVIFKALSCGGDYADLYFDSGEVRSLSLRDGQVTSVTTTSDFGVGVRVMRDGKTGYAYSQSTSREEMMKAAVAAGAIAQGAPPIASSYAREDGFVPRLYKGVPNPSADRYPEKYSLMDAETAFMADTLRRLQDRIRAKESRVEKIRASITFQRTDNLLFNSHEECKYHTRPLWNLVVTVIYSDGKSNQSRSSSRSYRSGTEMIDDVLIEEMADEVTSRVDELFDARRPKGGKMSVVMGRGASGILLHEAMGHAFEADFIERRQSIFTDRIGQQVCPRGINIVDDATITADRGALDFDDEGVPGQKTYMVTDGILTSYLHDRRTAAHFKVAPTGNGRRQSFRYNPIPRMRCTYMESGDAAPEDIIASVKEGIYVDEFSNGQVKIGEGDFTFFVKMGYLIENGRLTAPISDINVIGNGPEALSRIRAVGNDCRIDHGAWTCGKGQNVAVSCGIPTVLIDELTVGGE